MRLVITNELGNVKLGDKLLPGIYEGCEIRGAVKMDDIDVPGQSGKSTQPKGFEDATISLRIRLQNDENSSPYDKAKILVDIFQKTDGNAKPFIYRIVNHLTDIWKIKEVIFKELVISDANYSDSLRADIQLRQYKPVMVKKETKVNPTKQDPKNKNTNAFASGLPKFEDFQQNPLLPKQPKLDLFNKNKTYPGFDNDFPNLK